MIGIETKDSKSPMDILGTQFDEIVRQMVWVILHLDDLVQKMSNMKVK